MCLIHRQFLGGRMAHLVMAVCTCVVGQEEYKSMSKEEQEQFTNWRYYWA